MQTCISQPPLPTSVNKNKIDFDIEGWRWGNLAASSLSARAALGAAPEFFALSFCRSVQIYLHLRPSQYFTRVTNILFDVVHSSARRRGESALCFHMQIYTLGGSQWWMDIRPANWTNVAWILIQTKPQSLWAFIFPLTCQRGALPVSDTVWIEKRAKMPCYKSPAVKKRFSNNWNVCTKNTCHYINLYPVGVKKSGDTKFS